MLIRHLTAVVSRIAGRKLGDARTAEDVSHSELTASAEDKTESTHIVPAVLPFTCRSFWAQFFPQ